MRVRVRRRPTDTCLMEEPSWRGRGQQKERSEKDAGRRLRAACLYHLSTFPSSSPCSPCAQQFGFLM